jgi:hypothetical protein
MGHCFLCTNSFLGAGERKTLPIFLSASTKHVARGIKGEREDEIDASLEERSKETNVNTVLACIKIRYPSCFGVDFDKEDQILLRAKEITRCRQSRSAG